MTSLLLQLWVLPLTLSFSSGNSRAYHSLIVRLLCAALTVELATNNVSENGILVLVGMSSTCYAVLFQAVPIQQAFEAADVLLGRTTCDLHSCNG